MKKLTSYKELREGVSNGTLKVFTGTKIDLYEFSKCIEDIVLMRKSNPQNNNLINDKIKTTTWKIENLYHQITENCKRNGLDIYSHVILYHELKANKIDCFKWTFKK